MIARDTSQIITVVMICLGENMRELRRLSIAKIERFGKRKQAFIHGLANAPPMND